MPKDPNQDTPYHITSIEIWRRSRAQEPTCRAPSAGRRVTYSIVSACSSNSTSRSNKSSLIKITSKEYC